MASRSEDALVNGAETADPRSAEVPETEPAGASTSEHCPDKAMLMASISEVLEGRDLRSFRMKDMLEALEDKLGVTAAEVEARRAEIVELAQAEVQRITKKHVLVSKNSKKAAGKRKKVSEVDWRRLVQRREEKLAKATRRSEAQPDGVQAEEKVVDAEDTDLPEIHGALSVQIGEHSMELSPKTFSSGTQGYHGLARLVVSLDGRPRSIMCQVSCALLDA
mmetsp:Transcript_6399/g.11702  ORF Transcript_6399/g.11702 Transcript_6399/m.11702 type:complete len:221 (-) Transcript_6399:120-782(-)